MKPLLLLTLLVSCTTYHTLQPAGEVLEKRENSIRVKFPDILHPDKQGAAWFYFPGIGLRDTSEYRVIIKIEEKQHTESITNYE
jgi:hypothetical protein